MENHQLGMIIRSVLKPNRLSIGEASSSHGLIPFLDHNFLLFKSIFGMWRCPHWFHPHLGKGLLQPRQSWPWEVFIGYVTSSFLLYPLVIWHHDRQFFVETVDWCWFFPINKLWVYHNCWSFPIKNMESLPWIFHGFLGLLPLVPLAPSRAEGDEGDGHPGRAADWQLRLLQRHLMAGSPWGGCKASGGMLRLRTFWEMIFFAGLNGKMGKESRKKNEVGKSWSRESEALTKSQPSVSFAPQGGFFW